MSLHQAAEQGNVEALHDYLQVTSQCSARL